METTKTERQGLTKSYRQRLSRLYVRLDAALIVARTPDTSPPGDHGCCDQPSTTDTPAGLRRNVAECRHLWQRTKEERLLVHHTYTPGETSRRSYARVSAKLHDNTIISLGGKAASGPNRSQELADEMADGWAHTMTHSFSCPEGTAAFLFRTSQSDRVDDTAVTSAVPADDVTAALKRLKRGKAAGPDEINNTFYRDYADALGPILAIFYTRWLTCLDFRCRSVKRVFSFEEICGLRLAARSSPECSPQQRLQVIYQDSFVSCAAIAIASSSSGSSWFCSEAVDP